MIDGFTIVLVAVATLVGLLCVVLGLVGRKPADVTILAVVLVEALVVAQVVIALVAPAVGNQPTGSLGLFWIYLGAAAVIPPAAIIWALADRSRWSTVVLGVGALAIAVMVFRMSEIWNVPLA
ncbi:MAG: hypothetical protein ABIR17_08315 [Pseudolysinimonas sp.]|uniref:hypothetical protein n=1 Tax=Pseudolysinimonas sp. TaxID=2680009 RepID=UPI0032662C52